MVVVYLVLFCVTCSLFPELTIKDQLKKAITGTMDGITYSVVDSMVRAILSISTSIQNCHVSVAQIQIYGNWLFDLVALVFVPSWTMLWCLMFVAKQPSVEADVATRKVHFEAEVAEKEPMEEMKE